MPESSLVRVRNLRFRYPDGTQALDGVCFDLFPGECVAVLGPNGSGKTTFLMHLNGLLSGEGEISICGIAVQKDTLREVRQKIGFVFQNSDDQLFMPTVLDDVAFGPLNLGMPPEQASDRARRALEQVGMQHAQGKAPYHLSAGQKKRVAIAGVLAMEPAILVLDEPTTFLDPPGRRALLELLKTLPQAKLLVTHDVGFARDLADRAVFFDQGNIAGTGTVEHVAEKCGWR
ncbi:MAG: ABC transporter ATP-binding protein [Bryobacterales bacterium]|nr:ABC transporter ATP-binding protein [Bryobacterales bacterium]